MTSARLSLYLSASLVVVLLGLLVAEVVTRLASPSSTVEYRIDPDVGQMLVANQRTRWVHEDFDEIVTTNSHGFHDHEHAIEKPSNAYRIVISGDSFIESLSSSIELGVTHQLEELLQEKNRLSIEVINVGVSGAGPCQHLRMLEMKGMAYHPDLIIMSVFPDNDFWDSEESLSASPSKIFYRLQPDGSLTYIPPTSSWVTVKVRPWLRKSAFLNLLRTKISYFSIESLLGQLGVLLAPGVVNDKTMRMSEWGVYISGHPEPWPNAYQTTLQCIKSASDLAVKIRAGFAVVLIAPVASVENRWDEALARYPEAKHLHWDFEYPFTAITELGQRAGFGVINLLQPFRKDFFAKKISRSWPHDGHWNPSGNRLAAEIIASHLVANRMQYALTD